MKQKVILITGASSGIGLASAKQLVADGHVVYASARRPEAMSDIKSFGAHPLDIEMTETPSLVAAVDTIIAEQGRIDVLFNNAGYGLYGPVEDLSIEDARKQFDVNIFGLAALTKIVLPHMRRQGSGTIINTSSMGGKMYTPFGAWYHATKHALEGWSDCLRLEVKQFGIDVVLIEPGLIQTNFGATAFGNIDKIPKDSAYIPMIKALMKAVVNKQGEMKTRGSDPSVIATVVSKVVAAKHPKTRYASGKMSKFLLFVRKYTSDRFFDRFIMKAFS